MTEAEVVTTITQIIVVASLMGLAVGILIVYFGRK